MEENYKNKPSNTAVQHFKDTLEKYLSALNVSITVEVRKQPFKITSFMAGRSSIAYHWLDVYVSTPELEKFHITLHLMDGIDEDVDDRLIWGEAQKVFIRDGGPQKDPYGLDRNKNGIACESLRK